MRRFPLLCLAVLSASCGTWDEPRRDDVAVGSTAQQAPHWNLVEEWRVGGAADGPHALTNVRAIRVLPNGRLVVLETADQQVHILSPQGVPIRTFGRRGKGPGEFVGAEYLLVAPNGQIIVYDITARRLTFFSADGDLLKTEPHAGGAHIGWIRSDGRLEDYGTQVVDGPNGRESVDFRVVWSTDYTTADTVSGAPCPLLNRIPSEFQHWAFRTRDSGRYFVNYPFLPQNRLVISDGVWISPFPDFRVLHHITVGTCAPAVTITLQGAPVPVPGDMHRELQNALRAHARRGDTLSPDPNRVRAALPLLEALFTDTQDRLWVARLVDSTVQFAKSTMFGMPTLYSTGTTRFEVFSPQGTLVALVSAPSYIGTPVYPPRLLITGDHVYTIVSDEDGVPYLCSFRIVVPAL